MAAKKRPAKKTAAKKSPPKKKVPARRTTPKRPAKAAKAAKKRTKVVPQGYHVVTAYLCVDGAADAIDFYKRVFGAKERMRMDGPEGRIGHAELVIGDSAIMIADEFPEMSFRGPKKGEGTPVNMHLYVPDVDTMVANALTNGARIVRAIEDKFYGDRAGTIEDPFGHVWHLATHKEDLSPAEMKRRGEEMAKKGQ
jgi:PhnB protein